MLTLSYIKLMNALHSDRRGVTAVEHAVVAGVLVTVIATAFQSLGTGITNTLTSVVSSM